MTRQAYLFNQKETPFMAVMLQNTTDTIGPGAKFAEFHSGVLRSEIDIDYQLC